MSTDSRLLVSLNYLARESKFEEEKPFTCFIDLSAVPQAETSNIINVKVDNIQVADVRDNAFLLDLDKHGFEVMNLGQCFDAIDFEDERWLQDVYYPFICRFLIDTLGAEEAHVFEHQLRYRHPGFGDNKLRGAGDYDPPVSQVHADQTPSAALARFERHWPHFSQNLVEERLRIVKSVMLCVIRQYADEIAQKSVWRPLVPRVTEWPLALCDSRSVDRERDLQPSDIVKQDYVGESYVAYHNPAHEWHYLKNQTFEEAWLIKLFDSKPGVANTVLHTAIDTGMGSKARKSCEVRVMLRG